MAQDLKTALIIGGSRGLGLGLVGAYLGQGWRVIATQRSRSEALDALAAASDGRLTVETLDVTDDAGIVALRRRVASQALDLLFVSAGVNNDPSVTIGAVATEDFARVMLTNALAPMRIIEIFADAVAPKGTIAAMTSILGSVAANTHGGYEVYRASKAALNILLRSFAARHRERTILALHPGWVRTDMGGANADIGVDESVAGMVAVIAREAGAPGCRFLDYTGKPIAW